MRCNKLSNILPDSFSLCGQEGSYVSGMEFCEDRAVGRRYLLVDFPYDRFQQVEVWTFYGVFGPALDHYIVNVLIGRLVDARSERHAVRFGTVFD